MLYQAVCQLLDVTPTKTLSQFLPAGAIEKLQISPNFRLLDVQNLCRMLYDVRRDDALFRQHLVTHGFDWLRKTYPPRREFSSVCLQGQVPDYLIRLGFSQK
jgi:erythronate-4-phosphate dehydrogenase